MSPSFRDKAVFIEAHSIVVLFYVVRRLARKRRNDAKPNLDSTVLSHKVHICSVNNFPTAAGLASSAAGFACLGQNCTGPTSRTPSGTASFC